MTDDPTPVPCRYCGVPVEQVALDSDEWHWRAVDREPDDRICSHYAPMPGTPYTQAGREALPTHCGWVLYRAPSGWWCRECDLPLPQLGDWDAQRAVQGLIWKMAKGTGTNRVALLQRQGAAKPALALLRALQQAAQRGDGRALRYEVPTRTVLTTLDDPYETWDLLRQQVTGGPWTTTHTEPITLAAARQYAKKHTTRDTLVHVVPVPTSDPAAPTGWLTITREEPKR